MQEDLNEQFDREIRYRGSNKAANMGIIVLFLEGLEVVDSEPVVESSGGRHGGLHVRSQMAANYTQVSDSRREVAWETVALLIGAGNQVAGDASQWQISQLENKKIIVKRSPSISTRVCAFSERDIRREQRKTADRNAEQLQETWKAPVVVCGKLMDG